MGGGGGYHEFNGKSRIFLCSLRQEGRRRGAEELQPLLSFPSLVSGYIIYIYIYIIVEWTCLGTWHYMAWRDSCNWQKCIKSWLYDCRISTVRKHKSKTMCLVPKIKYLTLNIDKTTLQDPYNCGLERWPPDSNLNSLINRNCGVYFRPIISNFYSR